MHVVVHSAKEKQLLLQLVDYLLKQNIDFYLNFEDPISFQLEEILSELCACDIEVDKKENPIGIEGL
ncbi:MAG: hypothetical protein KAS63_11130 [Candidatus Heimdallarchaeota archaeon]|nr:hypothetical protein [Candidatus Heimdallarchaeota archaeon]MCK4955910.1 hypothetical protein [Candidatus Heimdallarchaeota archaeon]